MRTIYWIIGGVLVVLCVIGLVTYSGEKETQRGAGQGEGAHAEARSRRAPHAPGPGHLRPHARHRRRHRLRQPGKRVGKAVLYDQLTNGADFVGRRPVIIDRDILRGEALILETYCPDQLEHYRDKIDDLKTDDVATTDGRGARPPGSTRRAGRRVRLGAGGQREHVGGDDPAAGDQQGRRCAGRPAPVGGHGLLAGRRGGDRDLGRAGRRLRPPQGVPRRPGAVHRLVRADRAVDERRGRDRRADDPGRVGRDDPRLRHEPALGRGLRRRAAEGDHATGGPRPRPAARSARCWAACSSTPRGGRACSGSTRPSRPPASR